MAQALAGDEGAALVAIFQLPAVLYYNSVSVLAMSIYSDSGNKPTVGSVMKSMAQNGNKKAALVMKYDDKYDKMLNSVLIGNNIVNIVATSVATLLFTHLLPENEALAATVSTVVMTLAVLTFGEITPKTVAKRTADNFSKKVAEPLSVLTFLFTPLTFIFNLWQKFVLKFFKNDEDDAVTEEEILTVVEEAAEWAKQNFFRHKVFTILGM